MIELQEDIFLYRFIAMILNFFNNVRTIIVRTTVFWTFVIIAVAIKIDQQNKIK